MRHDCEIIRDLLPLYLDDVASPSSRRMVEEHLAECAACQGVLSRLKNEEAESAIAAEREAVIAGQRRFLQQKFSVAGSVIAGIFTLALVVCLIVNLASGTGLRWFFIVLASVLVAGSLSVVPLMAPEHKGIWTLGAFTIALLLLFGVCCLFTGGKWFFVAGTSVLFGLSVLLLPFASRSLSLPESLEKRRSLVFMASDTVLFALMMLAIGLYAKAPRFFPIAAAISVPLLLLAWVLFALLRHVGRVQTGNRYAVLRREAEKPRRRLQVWEILLLALGSPLWLAFLLSGAAVLLSVYLVIWAVILSLWAAEASMLAGAMAGAVMGLWAISQGTGLRGIALICAALVLAGLSILLFFGCVASTRGTAALTKKTALWLQSKIFGEERAK